MAKYNSSLTAARLRELFDYNENTGIFTRHPGGRHSRKSGGIAGGCTGGGYCAISIDNKKYQAHRLAWLYVYGNWPVEQIDHIDGDRMNNSISNLRESSHQTNHQNLHAAHHDSSSNFLGVSFDKGRNKWKAQICVERRNRCIGRFDTEELAHAAYLNAKRMLHPFCSI